MFNLPVGVGKELDDCDMICTHCDCKDDVDNGEYVNHAWYCNDCYKELFKKCPNCDVIISVDEELCEDCLAEKTYDESAQGMFEKLGYYLIKYDDECIIYSESEEGKDIYANKVDFDLKEKTFDTYMGFATTLSVSVELHKAITQQMKELHWL